MTGSSGSTSGANRRPRRGGRGGEQNFVVASISAFREFFFVYIPNSIGRAVGYLFFPFTTRRQEQLSNHIVDQQWQRQNIPMSLQSYTMPAGDRDSTASVPVYDSYLLSLLASQPQTNTATTTGDNRMSFRRKYKRLRVVKKLNDLPLVVVPQRMVPNKLIISRLF